jgi:hypothetical protein
MVIEEGLTIVAMYFLGYRKKLSPITKAYRTSGEFEGYRNKPNYL